MFELYNYQKAWINDDSRFKIALKARQIGFTTALCWEAIDLAINKKCRVLILSATERQSLEVMDRVYDILRIFKRIQGTEFPRENRSEIMFPNGSRIISLPANPGTVRGYTGHVMLDEFAFHRDAKQIWRAMLPIITRGYKVRVVSTPAGKSGKFYELWSDEQNDFSRHKTDIYDAVKAGLQVNLEEIRKAMDPDDFAQEYECVFLDEAHSYFPMELILGNISAACDRWNGKPKGVFYGGVDIGRKRDLTVIYILEKLEDVFFTRELKVLFRQSFQAQKRVIQHFLKKFPFHRICMDATGLGMQLAEDLKREYGSVIEPVTFTSKVKEDLATFTRMIFEKRQIRIPDDQDLIRDIHSIKKIMTAAGNIRFDADRNERSHADRFWVLALALHGANRSSGPITVVTRAKRSFSSWLRGVF